VPASSRHSENVRLLVSLASVTTRVEPELLRSLRLRHLPWLPVDVEADAWFSEFICSRAGGVGHISPVFQTELQRELTAILRAGGRKVRSAEQIGATIADKHRGMSAAVLGVEEALWHGVDPDPNGRSERIVNLATPTQIRSAYRRWQNTCPARRSTN